MDTFQRTSDGDIQGTSNSTGGQTYFNQIPHITQISSDPNLQIGGQSIGDQSQPPGLIPNIQNFGIINSGVNMASSHRSSPSLDHQYQLSTANLHPSSQGQPLMHHSPLMPAQHDDNPADANAYHGMMPHLNSYYSTAPGGMVSGHPPPMNAAYLPPHQGMLLSQSQQPTQQQMPMNAVTPDTNGGFGRQQMYMHQGGGPPVNNTMSQGQTAGMMPLPMTQQAQLPGMVTPNIPQQNPIMQPGANYGGVHHHLQLNGTGQRPTLSGNSAAANRAAAVRKPASWHLPNDGDKDLRNSMCSKIIELLQLRKQNAGQDWQDKLPTMAKRLEDALYNQAASAEIYRDPNTLKSRLQQLAQQMGGKQAIKTANPSSAPSQPGHLVASSGVMPTQQPQQQGMQQQQQAPPQQQQQPGMPPYQHPYAGQQQPPPYYQQAGQLPQPGPQSQQLPQQIRQTQYPGTMLPNNVSNYNAPNGGIAYNMDPNGHMNGAPGSHMAMAHGKPSDDLSHMMMQQQGMPGRMNSDPSGAHMSQQPQRQVVSIAQIQPLVGGQPVHPGMPSQGQQQQPGQPQLATRQISGGAVGQSHGNQPPPAGQTDDHRTQVLKQQQQRLLLLRHASKCPHDSGRCRVTPHCAGMKLLWKHIMSCKDQECKMSHCVSSRYVLSHYSKCKDQNCPVCGPVRKAIKQNYEKSKNVIENAKDSRVTRAIVDDPTGKKLRDGSIVARAARQHQLDPVSCAIYCLTNEQIAGHIKSIHEGVRITAAKVKEIFIPILDEILRLPHAMSVFGNPVDAVAFNLPDYHEKIKSPMDLGTVRKKLDSLQYRDYIYFVEDVHLTFDNAMLYNPKGGEIYLLAKQLKKDFDIKFKHALAKHDSAIETNRLNSEACNVCGETKLNFEPPVYYCNGSCGGSRIRRNAFFYAAGNNNYHWCASCFQELKENQPIRLPDMSITKSELAKSKKRHQEEAQENWVQCDECKRWVHDICGLFNSRRNFGDDVKYCCPACLVKRRSVHGDAFVAPLSSKTKASDLPRCNMTDFIEARLLERLEQAYTETANIQGIPRANVEKCPPLVLRQVSCVDKMQTTREGVRERYATKNYPAEFPCRVKCVTLFQNIDGMDVILFGMYVYEYGHKCPAPNQRRVYVSYLDSVHYLRPKRYRTVIYHEILISYLEYVKKRGFHTAHIWSCPPSKGDDYILYCHPVDQKTPKTDKLQKWYADMLDECVVRGIAVELTDLHTEYMVDPALDASAMPYFEGDYWTTEAEVIITGLNAEAAAGAAADEEDDSTIEAKSKRTKSSKAKAAVRSTRLSKPATLVKSERDPVMTKLASIIEPMKNTFFVARLYPKEYAENFADKRQEEIVHEAAAESNSEAESKRIEQQLQEDVAIPSIPVMLTKVPVAAEAASENGATDDKSQESDKEEDGEFDQMAQCVSTSEGKSGTFDYDGSEDVGTSGDMELDRGVSPMPPKEDNAIGESKVDDDGDGRRKKRMKVEDEAASSSEAKEELGSSTAVVKMEEEKAVVESRSSSADVKSDVVEASSAVATSQPSSNAFLACLRDDTEDVDDVVESDHWDTRQAFLNLCQGNHYQFDQLRRAKYTSMMVLYLMHNPDAPKFLPNCHLCHKDILVGGRYHCDPCDVDFCTTCYSQTGTHIHHHNLRLVSGQGGAGQGGHTLTDEERRERQRTLQLHVELLVHATDCCDPTQCKVKNCSKMKDFIAHVQSCPQNSKGCPVCKRVNVIINLHARKCRKESCRVLNCVAIRERLRNLSILQQQMDDRRRANVNEMYHSGSGTSRQSSADDDA